MAAHRLQRSVLFRVFAVTWLFVWMLAQGLCVRHCAASELSPQQGAKCCAKKSNESSGTSSGESPVSCGGLKVVLSTAKAGLDAGPVAILPTLAVLFVLPAADDGRGSVAPEFLRTRPRADFVFLPGQLLGAALYSTAPPAFA